MSHSDDVTKRLLLRRDVDRLIQQVADLEGVGESVAAIAETVHDLTARQKVARPEPIHWPDLDEETYAQAWPALLDWLREVWVARYPADARHLLGCWWQHPDVVDVLTAAWQTWQAAYRNPAAEAKDRADWQLRTRPAVADALADALRGCTHDRHEEPVARPDVVAGYSTGASV